jgi:alkyl hydroperoxide reductase subunit F
MNIILYTDRYDGYGKRLKAWLEERSITYTERDVAEDAAWDELGEVSGQYGIPVLTVDDQVIIGYEIAQLERALGPHKEPT